MRTIPETECGMKLFPEIDSLIRVDLEMVLDKLEMDMDQFIDFCILCGTDYVEGVKGVGTKRGLKLIKEYKCIENILEATKYKAPVENWRYQEARKMFKTPDNYRPTTMPPDLTFKRPKLDALQNLLVHDFMVPASKADHYLTRLEGLRHYEC